MQPGSRKLTSQTRALKNYIKESHQSMDNTCKQPNDLNNLGTEFTKIQKSIYA